MKEAKPPASSSGEFPEANDKDFQLVLKELLAAYLPVLEEELKRAKSPETLGDEAFAARTCEEELELANRIFEPFTSEKVALSYLPAEARKLLGEPARWRWCLLHIRCCLVFGWLVCRGPRTFRSWAYYLNLYWRCVRQVLDTPVSNPLTAEQKKDFEVLVNGLAEAYKPFLTDQLASVEFPTGIPDAVIQGQINCFTDEEEICVIFERLINPETARALLGEAAFERHSKESWFWFCRCWCLCALCLGCCLARARNVFQIRRCLALYWRCLRDCFRPLIAQINTPTENQCVNTVVVPGCGSLIGVQITGTASGGAFNHYTLSYSWGGPPVNDAVVYPDCSKPPANPSSSVAVNGGTLGYLDVTMLPPGQTSFTIYLDVYDSGAGHLQVTRDFQLKTVAVEITAVAKVNTVTAQDAFLNPMGGTIKQIKDGVIPDPSPAVPELSVGGMFSVDGSAYIVGCNRLMTQYKLVEFHVDPNSPVPTFASAAGGTQLIPDVVYGDSPAHPWQSGCLGVTPNTIENGDLVASWQPRHCPFPPHDVPKIEGGLWISNPLSGRYVIFLEVDDRALPFGTYPGTLAATDQVTVWIDNQTPIGLINSIGGLTGCNDLRLSDYQTLPAEIRGVAWDPPIDASAPRQAPNENFGSYSLSFQKNGDPLAGGPIPPATPNVRVPNLWPTLPAGAEGTLANWDIVSALDGGHGPLPPHSPKLQRGTRCAYVFWLAVSDTTHVGDSGNHNAAPLFPYAINIINDLP